MIDRRDKLTKTERSNGRKDGGEQKDEDRKGRRMKYDEDGVGGGGGREKVDE